MGTMRSSRLGASRPARQTILPYSSAGSLPRPLPYAPTGHSERAVHPPRWLVAETEEEHTMTRLLPTCAIVAAMTVAVGAQDTKVKSRTEVKADDATVVSLT